MDPETDSSSSEQLEEQDEQGWEDVEEDREDVQIKCLFDDKTFSSATEMLKYCKESHDFDIWKLRRDLNLEFLDLIKLINYIRTQVQSGDTKPDISSKAQFEDEKYLKPVLEDDALLYSLDDIAESDSVPAQNPLEAEVNDLREQLSQLQSQFTAYRVDVQSSLMQNLHLSAADVTADPPNAIASSSQLPTAQQKESTDTSYFTSYSHPSIHRTMLLDSLRTSTYRDFIYDNKSLFTNRTVLDVGCGTGILSMFSAKAGADVIAVDASAIVDKCRENVFANNLDGKVKVLRGKVEELDLQPLLTKHEDEGKVDIIVSEWMGYCLLYESMLDSVIYARDKYLKPTGLMAPSHARMLIAPLVDSELRIEQIDFWRDVYGFDMSGMLEHAYDEVIMQSVTEKEVMGKGTVFKELDLHIVTVEELSFTAPFEMVWEEGVERLEGWTVWFEMFFATQREGTVPVEAMQKNAHEEGPKAFSTGPFGKQTHWYQGVLLMKEVIEGIQAGEVIQGEIKYTKSGEGEWGRAVDIEVMWNVPGKGKGKQTWKLE